MMVNAAVYKKKDKRDKSAVDLWNELQSEYIALATGEYRKTDSSSTTTTTTNTQQQQQQQQQQSSSYSRGSARQSFGQRGIKVRLIGKGGRVRGNMAGKRQDQSARTVISGSMDIDIDEIGVPLHFCKILTKQETVTSINRHWLQSLLRKGEVNRIQSADDADSVEWNAQYINKDSFTLEIGQKVHRWLQNGDLVQMGRQPSLHKPSMMVHRVKRLPPGVLTFLLNLAVTPPYNADYDGDEMWLVVIQSYVAVAEARLLMHVPLQILSPQNARALIGFVYHSVLAAYHLGFRHVLFSREQMCQLLQDRNNKRTIPPPAVTSRKYGQRWTGKQLFSCMLPTSLDFESRSAYKRLVIRRGKWLSGYWTKAALSQLVLQLVRDTGYYATARFISVAQRTLKLFLDDYGATLGPLDLLNPCPEKTDLIKQRLASGIDTGSAYGGMTDADVAEHTKNAQEYMSKHLLDGCQSSSRLVHIIRSGTKGSNTNVLQLMACLGETMLMGKRVQFPTAHFGLADAESLAAKGFIASSFATGLKPYESFCHFASGREGILDTANKTSRVGYLQRKMARMLGDLRVESDGTVRDAESRIVMQVYGDDGFQPSCVETTKVRFASIINVAEFEAQYRHPQLDREWHLYLLPLFSAGKQRAVKECTSSVPLGRLFSLFLKNGENGDKDTVEECFTAPVLFAHVERLFHAIQRTCPAAFWDRLAVRKWPCMPTAAQWKSMETAVLRQYYPQGLLYTGGMVGAVACQSIFEPAMQMTMRTFYLPGVGCINLQSGLDQLNDICNATQGSAIPTMTVHVKPQFQGAIHDICKRIPGKFLSDYCSSMRVETEHTSDTSKRCPCIKTTRELLANNPGSIRAADYFFEFEVVDQLNVPLVCKSLARFLGSRTQVNILDCGHTVRVYFDRFHPLLEKKDSSVRFSFDLIMKDTREKLCISGCAKIKAAHVVGTGTELLLIGAHTEAIWSMPEVDMNRTITSDIREIETLFGVDAAALVLEDKLVACMQKQGVPLDVRHAKLLAANMTRSGRIVPNTGLGIATESQSALRKCTFEKMNSHLASEAACGTFDPVLGTVEALILSTVPRMGTNYATVLPPPSASSSPTLPAPPCIPKSYEELRDVPTVPPDYAFVKRFMPSSNLVDSYAPTNYQYASLGPLTSSGSVSTFKIDLEIPCWIRG